MKKIRVLQILSDSNIGGAGRLLYNLAECIDKRYFEFIYVFPNGSELYPLFKKQDPLNKIYTISSGKDRSSDLKAAFELSRIIKMSHPHIIHTHSSLFARMGAKLAGFDKNRVVYTKHCVFELPRITKSKAFRYAYRIADDVLAANIIAVADSAKDELVAYGVRSEKIKVIINGVKPLPESSDEEKTALRKRLGIKENDFAVGISARLEAYKGHKTLIEAAAISKKEGIKNIVFLIMGEGSYGRALKDYAKALGVTDRVKFLGFKTNVADYVNIFDVNVNCSVGTETSSLAISEGLSLGKPIVASDFGGNPNMVKNGVTGFLFKQNNAVSLYEKLVFLKNHPGVLKYMSNNAKIDFANRFSADIMAKEYERIYRGIINNT